VVHVDAVIPSGDRFLVRAGAADPQGESLFGRLDLFAEATQEIALDDPGGAFRCDAGYLPHAVAGQGSLRLRGRQPPVLFDLDGNLGCVDGAPDLPPAFGLHRLTAGFGTVLDLSAPLRSEVVCIRPAGAVSGGFVSYSTSSPRPPDRAVDHRVPGPVAPFALGLPRRTDITALAAGVAHRLVLTVTDQKTPPVTAEAAFVPQGRGCS
jgi:hypothetical protein